MQQSTIQYQSFQPSDYQALEDIIRKTWEFDRLGSPKAARQMAKIYLASCLVNQTFTCVAVSAGKPVGIIMGKNRKTHRKPLRYLIRQGLAVAQIATSKETRKIVKLFKKMDRVDETLLNSTQTMFDGELAFFVIDSNQRGNGIGKKLYQSFINYMASERLETFFLFTDTTCDYRFYEYQGLQRMAEQRFDIPQMQENMHFYLYGKA